jgi:hypothetical protein
VKYAIVFDFAEGIGPVFAGLSDGALGFAPTLATALLYDNEEAAERVLKNGYGKETSAYGAVVEVPPQ